MSKQEVDPRKIELSDVDQTLSSRAGRSFIFRILEYTSLDIDIFDADTHVHARNSGKRAIGIWLRDELKTASPGNYNQMIRENEEQDNG